MRRGSPTDKTIETTFPTPASTRSLPRELRVVTFNVHREPGDVVVRGIRGDAAVRDADLILLQEVHRVEQANEPCSAACTLGKDLGYYTLYAPGHVQGDGTDGVAILSRAPILSGQVMELPDIDVRINSGRRIALIATILVEDSPVTVYAVHLTNRLTVAERKLQMLPVLQHAKRQKTPVIIGGDFNTSPFTWGAGVVPIPTGTQKTRFEEHVRSFGFDTPVSESTATFRFIGMKLDGIYTRGFRTHTFSVASANNVSDHLPLWASIEPTERAVVASHPRIPAAQRPRIARTAPTRSASTGTNVGTTPAPPTATGTNVATTPVNPTTTGTNVETTPANPTAGYATTPPPANTSSTPAIVKPTSSTSSGVRTIN